MISIGRNINFYASPKDSESLLQHSIQLLAEQMNIIKKAEDSCKFVASLKETEERPAFHALAEEYQRLLYQVKAQLNTLLE